MTKATAAAAEMSRPAMTEDEPAALSSVASRLTIVVPPSLVNSSIPVKSVHSRTTNAFPQSKLTPWPPSQTKQPQSLPSKEAEQLSIAKSSFSLSRSTSAPSSKQNRPPSSVGKPETKVAHNSSDIGVTNESGSLMSIVNSRLMLLMHCPLSHSSLGSEMVRVITPFPSVRHVTVDVGGSSALNSCESNTSQRNCAAASPISSSPRFLVCSWTSLRTSFPNKTLEAVSISTFLPLASFRAT
mmetsp:Transcript_11775/g.16558  ORF Transcript_11775/g.16558 Transcript_11775/m.16558 type:complete len:241 (-) Transcript_11775:129-851(-)